jgi:hypothetical protein
MYDAFDRSYLQTLHRRRIKHAHTREAISGSFGVRHGLIKDPNWPPTRFPEEGTATQRRSLRTDAAFSIRIDGEEPVPVIGNISEGGVMFTLPLRVDGSRIEVIASVDGGERLALIDVLRTRVESGLVRHHGRFVDALDAAVVSHAIAGAVES